jgi:peptidoglycan/xylan/chitin deacetylase (PgdA/CDA1 family)
MKALVKDAAFRAALGAGRWLHRKMATVFCYHSFHPQYIAQFGAQCDYLRKHHTVISMRELNRLLRNGDSVPPNAVVLTVDDGHRDFYTYVFPVLREYGFPATMYLPTAFLDRTEGHEWLWFDRFTYAFQHSSLIQVEAPSLKPDEPSVILPLDTPAALTAARYKVAVSAQWLPSRDRDAYCDRMAEALRVRIPETPPEEFAPLSWDEVRTMADSRIEFGGHTVTHPILQIVETPQELEFEIAHSKLRIEEELQTRVEHFAYPSGKSDEVPPAAKDAVKQAGFETAVTTIRGQVGPGSDPLWLRRIGADPSAPLLWFERCAANFLI